MNSLQKTEMFGWHWVAESKKRLLEYLESYFENGSAKLLCIATGNPEQVMLAKNNTIFFQTVAEEFDLVLPDGEGIVIANRLLNVRTKKSRIVERLAGVEIVAELIALSFRKHGSMLVLGGRGYRDAKIKVGSSEFSFRAVTNPDQLAADSSRQQLFWLPAYEDVKQPTEAEETAVVSEIRKLKPQLVFVAFGAPQQELWVVQHKQLLADSGVKIVMVVGGAFDMLTGKVPRSPKVLRQLKLEWFWRLLQEPSRWRRQLALITFIIHTLRTKIL